MCRRQRQGTVIRTFPAAHKVQPRPWCKSGLFLVSAQTNVVLLAGNLQNLQSLQRQLDEKTSECESLQEETIWANNDAEMWEGAYYQTVSAERENAQLMYDNKQLKEEVDRAEQVRVEAEQKVEEAETRARDSSAECKCPACTCILSTPVYVKQLRAICSKAIQICFV